MVWELGIVVEKLSLLLSILIPLLCLRSKIIGHDLHSGHAGHKMLNVLRVRYYTVENQCREQKTMPQPFGRKM